MIVELAEELEAALKVRAEEQGVSLTGYVNEVLKRDLGPVLELGLSGRPFKTAYGSLAKYGPAPSAEEIDENRADMFRNFGERF